MKTRISNLCFVVISLVTNLIVWGAEEKNRILPEADVIITTTTPVRSAMPRAARPSQSSIPHETIRVSGTTVAPRDGVFRRLDVDTLVVKKEISVTDFVITGTFFAGNIVAAGTLGGSQLAISGPATIGGTLVVGGPIVGNLVGNVTGNVVGNLLGDVIGNVSGASSLNVLKTGDTMTGSLRINNATAPALQLETNATSATNDFILAIDSSGNVTKSTVQIGSLGSSGTSSNVPGALVQRDFIDGGFSAGTITALGLLSNLTGNVSGTVTGGLIGNVTGNVAGNLLGDVTGNLFGNVIGNVSGASSLNVLKTGDTMTGSLRINNATAPALQLETNATSATNDFILAIDSSGNVTKSTVQIGSLGSSGTSSNVPGALVQRDFIDGGFSAGTITALGLLGNLTGNVSGTVTGGLLGNVTGNVVGNVAGNLLGDVTGNLFGNVIGNVSGASSLNVLKAGDTMTGQLRVSTGDVEPAVVITGQGVIAAPALQLLNNPPASVTDTIVGIDALGNITKSVIPIGTIAGGTSGNVPNTLVLRDGSGNFAAGTIYANLVGDISGTLVGNISGAASLNVLKSGDAMSGTLNMTTNNITNVGTVNGVTVEAHAARHLPNGADPLTVGIPVTIQTSNSAGSANAFSRSDHVHAHGSQTDPSLHAEATDVQAGFMSAADKLMLMNATSGNVPNTLVLRDDSGNIAAQTLLLQGLDVVGTATFHSPVYNLFANVSPNNVLYVQKGQIRAPNQFNSVKAAVDSIVGSSATNLFVVAISPGVYIEDTITLKPYVSLRGESEGSTIIEVDAPSKDLIIGADNAYMRNLTLRGATNPGKAAVTFDGGTFTMLMVNFESSDILVKIRATAQPSSVSLVTAGISGTTVFSTAFDIQGTGLPCGMAISNSVWTPVIPLNPGLTCVNISGSGAFFYATTLGFGTPYVAPTPGSGTKFLQISNGATAQVASSLMQGFDVAFSAPAGIIGPRLNLLSVVAVNNNTDISVQDQLTQGSISGEFTRSKVLVDPAVTGLSVSIMEPTAGGITMVGPLFTGRSIDVTTNVSPALNDGTNLGLISNGLIYATTSSLVVTVSAGTGYLMQTTAGVDNLKELDWQTTTTILVPNTDNFVYLNNVGQVQVSLSQPPELYTLFLGKVRASSVGALFIEAIHDEADHTGTKLNDTFTAALGPIYISGSIVGNNGLGLSVTGGKYVYGTHFFDPVGASPLTWQAYLGAGTNEFLTTQTSVDYQQYDLNGTLTPIPLGYYAKHLLYVIGGIDAMSGTSNEAYALVYSQTVFSTLNAATVGSNPEAPVTWSGNIVPIASIIVKNAVSGQIAGILDARPRPGFVPSSVAGVTVHGNLLGLLADDHPQYVLTNGGRLMTGSLQMGSNDITFAGSTLVNGLVDGVKVSKHASRHLPGSVLEDPLPMGVPVTIGTTNILSQSGGVVNDFAYSDHVHAHGDLPGGGLHALVTTVTAGFMSNTDYITLVNATAANTPDTLVKRDAGGNFAAGTITANLVGDISGNISGNLTVPAGSSAAPSIAFSGNTNTGIYSPGSNQIALTTNGTERFAVGATGTVTITGLNSVGVVHTDGVGNLSTSLIVNNDITNGTIANNKLATATSSNTPNYLVERDANGDFAARVITASLLGDVTGNVSGHVTGSLLGNVTGNVVGNLLGDVTGNVHGNIVGNLLGDVTGNVVGNVSGAASLNVLKTGDTMTGSLRIENTTAPALQLLTNATSSPTDDILTIDSFGNVTRSTAQIGSLTGGTSSDVPNTLVLRDNSGNFAAGTITADLLGNVTGNVSGQVTGSLLGNVTGNVTGNLVGNVLGNVTGNVAGNLFGNVTGNVVGNVSGAASANVLKTGDTMTGTLRIENTIAPALQLLTNATSSPTDDILTIDSFGNVTRSTAQIGSLTGGTSSDVPNTLVLRDSSGNFAAGTITAGLIGNVTGNVTGQVTGGLLGNVTGNVIGNLLGDVTGNVTGNLVGNVLGNVTGNVVGNLLGNVTGNVVGNVSGAASANVLKTGDTMTGTLRIENTTAPALQLLTSVTSSPTDDILTIDSSGNVTRSTATIGSLTSGTSTNVPNTLVLRDGSGNFAAGTITADLVGNVTGNVSGQVTGSLLGNVTGNVVGNVLGDVTGNVVGNVSGAASANVLKTGDTMTGTLRVSSLVAAAAILSGQGSTTAPALQLFNNLPATNTDNFLAIDGSGNVSQTTVPAGLLTGATSGNVPNTLVLRDGAGSFAANTVRAQGLDVVGTSTFNSQVYNFFATVSPNNVLYVHKGPITAPNEFNSIKAAVDSIAGSSITNRFAVTVAPGVYIEDTITLQPYVGIIGIDESSVVIQVDATNKDIIHGADNGFLKALTLQGATDPGMAAISIDGGMMSADNINFGSSDILMKIRATAAPGGSTITLTNVLGAGVFTTAFDIQSNDFPGPIYPCGLTFSSLTWSPSAPMASTMTFAKVQGPGSYLVGASLSAGSFSEPPTTGTKFLELFNGGFVEIATASISGFDTAFSVPSGAVGSTLILLAIATINNNTDISIQDQAISGSISGEFNRNKITIDPAATGLALFITDGGITSVGSFFSGRSIGTITNISPATNYGTNLGVITGGEMYTNPASLVLTVSAGQGYLMQTNAGMDDLKLVSWATTQTTLIANKDNYVFIDNNGLPNVALADSSSFYTIPLGKARASALPANGILYIQEILQDAAHTATKLTDVLELALGPIYVSGSITSQNGATPSDLVNVTSGQYTFGDRIFYPVGGTPITWQAYLGAGANEFLTTQTAIDYQRWDNGGGLSPIPANYYATHLLYVIGGYDPDCDRVAQTYALVYSQTVYSTLIAAEVGALPTAPTSWTGNIVPISLVIVKNNSATKIVELLDERPRPGFVASSIAGVTVHGNLLGLLADDHPQYLLTNGGRTMTGDLQMGTNSISNVGTVNGVTVELHGARHGANNLDPIPTGVLADIQPVGITSAAGASNAFTRADHVHAHGNLPGGTLHAVADIVTAGFMSAADKQTLVDATAANTPSTLVKRDSNGDFAAGTITAGLIGNVTGNMSGNVSGTVTGSLIGNVTGNVAGNLLGDVTGNVVGNVSGAASANVLKVGDTMTGQLRISDSTLSPLVVTGNGTTPAVFIVGQSVTAAPALRLSGNPTAVGTDVLLAIDLSGNVTQSSVALGGLNASATSGNQPNTLVLRDAFGNFAAGTITAGLVGHVTGNVNGNVSGIVTGSLIGNVTGNVVGNLLGDVTGNVNGNVSGAASANVLKVGDTMTGQLRISDSIHSPLVVTGNGTTPAVFIVGQSVTAAPALRLSGNPSSVGTDTILAIDGSGNITQTTIAIGGLGTAGTSGNVGNTLVLRDALGNFAAGTITAGLVGHVTGNVNGNVSGTVTGSLIGNVTGNVAGNLLGNVTGNVVGNVSGAASANVLKIGDTMTGQLRISDVALAALIATGKGTTAAPALRLLSNPTSVGTDVLLGIDSAGNVTETTFAISGLGTAGTSGNVGNTLVLRDANGNFAAGTITAGLLGYHTGNMSGNLLGDVTGNVSGTVTGSLIGNVTGNVAGNLLGNVTGNVVGNVSGAASANVLKVGDTMTGQLRISDATTEALVLTGNNTTPAALITGGQSTTTSGVLRLVNTPTTGTTDNVLALDAGGNVTKSSIVTVNSAGAVTFGAGSAALPSVTFSGNTNTGLYSPGTNQVALTTNGTQRLLVDMSGAVTINAPTANAVGLTVTGNSVGSSDAVVINQGNNAASGNALMVNAAVLVASSPAVTIVGAANAADLMTITGAAGAGATGRGLVIDKSQASASGVGLQVTSNTLSPASLFTGNSTTQAPALRLAGVPSLPSPSLAFNTTGFALTTDVTGNVMASVGSNGDSFRTFFSQPNWYRPIDPRREMTFYDDFMGSSATTVGSLQFADTNWKSAVNGGASLISGPTVSADAFGIVRLTIGNNNGGYCIIAKNVAQNVAPIYFSLGKFVLEMRVNFDQTTADYTFRIGLGGFTTAFPAATDFTSGVYFEYTPATSANWLCKTASGSVLTTVDSGVAATANTWHTLRIEVNETGTAVNYYIDDVLVTAVGTPITTNIPVTAAAACGPIAQLIRTTATTARNLNIDYWYQQYVFNTVR